MNTCILNLYILVHMCILVGTNIIDILKNRFPPHENPNVIISYIQLYY